MWTITWARPRFIYIEMRARRPLALKRRGLLPAPYLLLAGQMRNESANARSLVYLLLSLNDPALAWLLDTALTWLVPHKLHSIFYCFHLFANRHCRNRWWKKWKSISNWSKRFDRIFIIIYCFMDWRCNFQQNSLINRLSTFSLTN